MKLETAQPKLIEESNKIKLDVKNKESIAEVNWELGRILDAC